MSNSKLYVVFMATFLSVTTHSALADEVIADDLIVKGDGSSGSLCVGTDCADGEEFGFDTIRLKSADPILEFLDTSNSASFPSNDWSMGVANSGTGSAPQFYLKDDSNDTIMLLLQAGAAGGVAMGANATLEDGAISVGNVGGERRVAFVADGVDPTDAATKSQLDTFIASIGGSASDQLTSDREALDAEIADLETELAGLVLRLSALEAALEN